ncbi:hypothetical protein B0H13DRAFT_1906652 [Mycena leptocephala]|nr:hypothetical protein B0H13DRAFT_1906652 [Mycena leptocephala]
MTYFSLALVTLIPSLRRNHSRVAYSGASTEWCDWTSIPSGPAINYLPHAAANSVRSFCLLASQGESFVAGMVAVTPEELHADGGSSRQIWAASGILRHKGFSLGGRLIRVKILVKPLMRQCLNKG